MHPVKNVFFSSQQELFKYLFQTLNKKKKIRSFRNEWMKKKKNSDDTIEMLVFFFFSEWKKKSSCFRTNYRTKLLRKKKTYFQKVWKDAWAKLCTLLKSFKQKHGHRCFFFVELQTKDGLNKRCLSKNQKHKEALFTGCKSYRSTKGRSSNPV